MSAWRTFIPVLVVLTGIPSGCRKSTQVPKKPARAEVLREAEAQRAAINSFAAGLREALIWRASDPAADTQSGRSAFPGKLRAVPAGQLPESLSAPWHRLLSAMEQASSGPADSELEASAAAAAAELNQQLFQRGYLDVQF